MMGASQWELLNLDVDTILKMPVEVQTLTGLEHQEFMGIMGSYLYESVGAQEFARRHMLTKSPCIIAPSTAHISFTKAVTILGLGRESLVTVAVDEDARMEPKGNLRTCSAWCTILELKFCVNFILGFIGTISGNTAETILRKNQVANISQAK